MGSFEVKITDNTPKLLARLDKAEQIVKKFAFDVLANAVVSIKNGQKSGRRYGKHTASAPGEAPASDTGALANSGQVKQESRFVQVIGFSSKYAKPLEIGTRKTAARPFLLPALMMVKKAFLQALESIFRG